MNNCTCAHTGARTRCWYLVLALYPIIIQTSFTYRSLKHHNKNKRNATPKHYVRVNETLPTHNIYISIAIDIYVLWCI